MQRELPKIHYVIDDEIPAPAQGELVCWPQVFSEADWGSLRDAMETSGKRYCVAEGDFYDCCFSFFNSLPEAVACLSAIEKENGTRASLFMIEQARPITCLDGFEVNDGIPF